ncbi:NAD-P-binding protein [Trametes versicolor FP-101664 SS1]|uniref:NAD-P-binding protein n=1 Tax=Trametes versicolor (strain FP-101664) TaxID=717944 RepID=UPI0004622167|nr:NAD-P-binding protein [Trametes versicolor FP-101664 SS1]EIW54837.1 NAD-P-binding protein [Trametes versicolor FP-101664 SS1]
MADTALTSLTASNLFDLTGVVAVVTGGGSGIGLMIASTLLANGATVYIIGPKQADLDRVANVYNDAAEKASKPGKMYGIEGDIRLKSEALRLAEEVGKREKHITVLFNNAGVLSGSFKKPTVASADAFRTAYFDEVPESSFDDNLRTNAIGPYWLTFAFLPLLEKWKQNPEGARFAPQIVMTSSMNGWTKDPATAGSSFPYMYSKSAIGHATSSLAHELLPLGIRVNGIAPGLFITEMSAPGSADAIGQSRLPPDYVASFEVPVSRPVDPGTQRAGTNKDMGALVLFLVANWFVDGETVLIDGGTLLKHPSSY